MAKHLKEIRKDRGLTMREMAQVLGTPHSFIGKVENLDRRLDIAELALYCKALERDPSEVYQELLAL